MLTFFATPGLNADLARPKAQPTPLLVFSKTDLEHPLAGSYE
jgi:hypothetical protein